MCYLDTLIAKYQLGLKVCGKAFIIAQGGKEFIIIAYHGVKYLLSHGARKVSHNLYEMSEINGIYRTVANNIIK